MALSFFLQIREKYTVYYEETVSLNGRAVLPERHRNNRNEDAESTHNPHCFFLF